MLTQNKMEEKCPNCGNDKAVCECVPPAPIKEVEEMEVTDVSADGGEPEDDMTSAE